MDGRSGKHSSRSRLGRSFTAPGSRLLSSEPCSAGLYRRMGRLPQEHHACLSRQREKDCRKGKSLLRGVAELCIATVIKRTEKKRVVEVTRKLTWGTLEKAETLLNRTLGCTQFNTSLIERF